MILVVLAAGKSQRFGNENKILAKVGPKGEFLLDYAVEDALKAGFSKIVIVTRQDTQAALAQELAERIAERATLSFVLSDEFEKSDCDRRKRLATKPLGTLPSLLSAEGELAEAFAVINADDYYGYSSFAKLYEYMAGGSEAEEIATVVFPLKNTLSSFGGVTRGICDIDAQGMVEDIRETNDITEEMLKEEGLMQAWTSMNMWGMSPAILPKLAACFKNLRKGTWGESGGELPLSVAVQSLLREKKIKLRAIKSEEPWFGLTYREDVAEARRKAAAIVAKGN